MTDDELIVQIAKLYDRQEELENEAELLSCESCKLLAEYTQTHTFKERQSFISKIYHCRLSNNTKSQ